MSNLLRSNQDLARDLVGCFFRERDVGGEKGMHVGFSATHASIVGIFGWHFDATACMGGASARLKIPCQGIKGCIAGWLVQQQHAATSALIARKHPLITLFLCPFGLFGFCARDVPLETDFLDQRTYCCRRRSAAIFFLLENILE